MPFRLLPEVQSKVRSSSGPALSRTPWNASARCGEGVADRPAALGHTLPSAHLHLEFRGCVLDPPALVLSHRRCILPSLQRSV